MKRKLAVIVGRFQTPFLHEGHIKLIDQAFEECEEVLILVGSCIVRSKKNPLTFNSRMHMILDSYPKARVSQIKDKKDDMDWAQQLNNKVQKELVNTGYNDAVLYGSRDSYIQYYINKYSYNFAQDRITTCIVEQRPNISATDIRSTITPVLSEDYRRGYVKAVNDTFPASTAVVDNIVYTFRGRKLHILVGTKHYNNNAYYLPGGFVDSDQSLEDAASRELREETGLNVRPDHLEYLTSKVLDQDWRYLNSEVKPITTVFSTYMPSHMLAPNVYDLADKQIPKANDDLSWVGFMEFSDIEDKLVPFHAEFVRLLIYKKFQ